VNAPGGEAQVLHEVLYCPKDPKKQTGFDSGASMNRRAMEAVQAFSIRLAVSSYRILSIIGSMLLRLQDNKSSTPLRVRMICFSQDQVAE